MQDAELYAETGESPVRRFEEELAATAASTSSAIPADYPHTFRLQDILREWNPDDVFIPASYGKYASLRKFDYQVCGPLPTCLLSHRAQPPWLLFILHDRAVVCCGRGGCFGARIGVVVVPMWGCAWCV